MNNDYLCTNCETIISQEEWYMLNGLWDDCACQESEGPPSKGAQGDGQDHSKTQN